LAVVNEGNAMDLTSGKFTAPRPGIYFFSFTGVAGLYSSSSYVYFYSNLYLNGNQIGASFVADNNGPVDKKKSNVFPVNAELEKRRSSLGDD
jgi:hypothetical protein